MTIMRQTKTNFTAGEINRRLLGRGDLKAYDNGALSLRNVFIHPTGGISRRAGFAYIDTAEGYGRLIAFEFNTEQIYLLVLTDEKISVYEDGALLTSFVAPWTEAQLDNVAWTQSADTLLLCHPDVIPQTLTRNTGGAWSLEDWNFLADSTRNDAVLQPYYKFALATITLAASATTGTVNITASSDFFVEGHEGTRLRIKGKEVLITDVASPTVAAVTVIETLTGTAATDDWAEQSFSAVRGYPMTVAFHQDRLVIGGSRDLPNRLWFSQTGDLWNFDLGSGLDDEAIEFGIFSDQVNAIRAVFSSRDLQVFTSGGEWQVRGTPLTPQTVQLSRQTRIGSRIDRYVPPVDVDGATMFIARNGNELREFLYTDLEAAYQATDLALVAKHIVEDAVDQCFDPDNRLLFVVRGDGQLASLTLYRTEQVSAWTLHETQGTVVSVTAVGDDTYILVQRNGAYVIEVMDHALYLDSALSGEVEVGTTTWSGLDHLEGMIVSIIADDIVQADMTVSSGQIILSEAANSVVIGLSYAHIVEPLPPSIVTDVGSAKTVRLIEAVFRMEGTAAFRLDVGNGLQDIPLRDIDEPLLDEPAIAIQEDISVKALGWRRDLSKPLWRIEQSAPLPFTLLSVITELKIGF